MTNSSALFVVNGTSLSDSGLYRCLVEDEFGQQWNDTAFLYVNGLNQSISQSINHIYTARHTWHHVHSSN